jgi:thioredoxin-related protein
MKAEIYTTDWCGPCNMMKNMYLYELIESGYNIELVNIEEEPDRGGKFNVTSVPHSVFYDADGNVVHEQTGFMPKVKFLQLMGE